MTDKATLTARLAEAEAALHELRLGRSAVQVRTSDGKSVVYSAADAGQLQTYIGQLRRQLGLRSRGSAIGVSFR